MKKILLSIIGALTLLPSLALADIVVPESTLSSRNDSLAYAYGMMFGQQYSNFSDPGIIVPGVTLNTETFLAAFVKAMRQDTTSLKMSNTEAETFMRNFQMEMQAQMERERQAIID